MPYVQTTTAPGTCPICGLERPATAQITCARCWSHVLNGKDRQELAAIHRQAGKKSDEACAPKCAKIARRVLAKAEKLGATAPIRPATPPEPPRALVVDDRPRRQASPLLAALMLGSVMAHDLRRRR